MIDDSIQNRRDSYQKHSVYYFKMAKNELCCMS